jgi:hypothetical protein
VSSCRREPTCWPIPPSRSANSPDASFRSRAFGDDNDTEPGAVFLARFQATRDRLEIEGNLGDENRVGAARDTRVERDPAGITAHDLRDHDAVVSLGGRVQAIDGVGGEADGGIEAEAVGRADNVIVDRLRHADEGDPALRELVRDGERAVAADANERVEPQLVEHVDAALRVVARAVARFDGIEERITPVHRAENRAADAKDARDVLGSEDPMPVGLDEAIEAVFEAQTSDAVIVSRLDDGANDGVQAGSISTAREDTDPTNSWHTTRVTGAESRASIPSRSRALC